mmetsp:Transcript_43392/g.139475  ORF Transcript_43392/g.139475 Transcript_43392/m.139475 type:complete len:231 (+) Transcript_43392:1003-1695(+)
MALHLTVLPLAPSCSSTAPMTSWSPGRLTAARASKAACTTSSRSSPNLAISISMTPSSPLWDMRPAAVAAACLTNQASCRSDRTNPATTSGSPLSATCVSASSACFRTSRFVSANRPIMAAATATSPRRATWPSALTASARTLLSTSVSFSSSCATFREGVVAPANSAAASGATAASAPRRGKENEELEVCMNAEGDAAVEPKLSAVRLSACAAAGGSCRSGCTSEGRTA